MTLKLRMEWFSKYDYWVCDDRLLCETTINFSQFIIAIIQVVGDCQPLVILKIGKDHAAGNI